MSNTLIMRRHNAYIAITDEHRQREPPPGGGGRAVVNTEAMNNGVNEYIKMINRRGSPNGFENAIMAVAEDREANPTAYPNYPIDNDYDPYKYRRTAANIKHRRIKKTKKLRKHRKHRKAKKSRKT